MGGEIREGDGGEGDRLREVGGEKLKCAVCQQGNSAYSCTPAPRTQQMIIIQDKVNKEAPYTMDFLSRRKLFPSLLPVLSNPLIYLLNMFPGKRKRPPSYCHKKKKGAVFLP